MHTYMSSNTHIIQFFVQDVLLRHSPKKAVMFKLQKKKTKHAYEAMMSVYVTGRTVSLAMQDIENVDDSGVVGDSQGT